MKRLEERQKSELILSTLSIGGIRYDAFQDVSGKLSFSLAFMAGEKGIILTSIHTREQSYLYLKPYDKDKTSLTEEEKKAVEIALKDGYTIKDT
jgi:predicted DNA binding protein